MEDFMKAPVPKENEVVSGCLRFLNACGIFAWRNNNMGTARKRGKSIFYTFNGIRGVADIIGVVSDGRILCCECKRPGKLKDQSDEQKYFEEQIVKSNGIYVLVDSWEMLEQKLKEKQVIK
jgi:hypothetical protein